jgi:hypothetical protein
VGSLVLNPSWLRYAELENKAFYLTFKDFDDLLKLLSENIRKKTESEYCDKLKYNKEFIFNMCSWKAHTRDWRRLYRDVMKKTQ